MGAGIANISKFEANPIRAVCRARTRGMLCRNQ
jgi:hypothetical protein